MPTRRIKSTKQTDNASTPTASRAGVTRGADNGSLDTVARGLSGNSAAKPEASQNKTGDTVQRSTPPQQDTEETMADKVKAEAKSAERQVKQEASQIAQDLRDEASRIVDSAKQQSYSYFAERRRRTCEEIEELAEALEQVSTRYRDRDRPSTAHYIDRAAGRVREFSHNVESRSFSELLDEVQTFARRRPAVVLGSAVALGFLASRFVKASARTGSDADTQADGSSANREFGGA